MALDASSSDNAFHLLNINWNILIFLDLFFAQYINVNQWFWNGVCIRFLSLCTWFLKSVWYEIYTLASTKWRNRFVTWRGGMMICNSPLDPPGFISGCSYMQTTYLTNSYCHFDQFCNLNHPASSWVLIRMKFKTSKGLFDILLILILLWIIMYLKNMFWHEKSVLFSLPSLQKFPFENCSVTQIIHFLHLYKYIFHKIWRRKIPTFKLNGRSRILSRGQWFMYIWTKLCEFDSQLKK